MWYIYREKTKKEMAYSRGFHLREFNERTPTRVGEVCKSLAKRHHYHAFNLKCKDRHPGKMELWARGCPLMTCGCHGTQTLQEWWWNWKGWDKYSYISLLLPCYQLEEPNWKSRRGYRGSKGAEWCNLLRSAFRHRECMCTGKWDGRQNN